MTFGIPPGSNKRVGGKRSAPYLRAKRRINQSRSNGQSAFSRRQYFSDAMAREKQNQEFNILDQNPMAEGGYMDHFDKNKMFGNRFGNVNEEDEDEENLEMQKLAESIAHSDEIDSMMGFQRYQEGPVRTGWMVNMQPTHVFENETMIPKAAVDLYMLENDGSSFKVTVQYEPYLYVICRQNAIAEVEEFVARRFEGLVLRTERESKIDLNLDNHLTGKMQNVLKLVFVNTQNLMSVRKVLLQAVIRNRKNKTEAGAFEEFETLQKLFESTSDSLISYDYGSNHGSSKKSNSEERTTKVASNETLDKIVDLREYDLMYYVRVAIDCEMRVGLWYDVKPVQSRIDITPREDLVKRADPVVLAFDIETTKLPLKFPDSSIDSIMMISYMIDGQGFLITNREIISEDIDDFAYTPKPEFEGEFTIFNEVDEKALLERFFEHIRQSRPTVFVTYNGDFFDWPFIDDRAKFYGIDMYNEIGFERDASNEYKSRYAIHMDALCWVKRDSYLPQGSQGLKAVTTSKLGYNPIELDPEDMTRFASEKPQVLSQYSVSDAVATYYLYMKYVHPFIFSLCNIIPMHPDDVLRRGSGTLCEHLLMVEAFRAGILMPNKHVDKPGQLFEGHLIESETYVGGHVEALETGVYRSDIPLNFQLSHSALNDLINEIDDALKFSLKVENNVNNFEDVENYDEVKTNIINMLNNLKNQGDIVHATPLIYHLDVAAMYPNIILTNRLQPDSLVTEDVCAKCDFNRGPDSNCQRKMDWSWRGEFFPATKSEYNMIVNQLEKETFPGHTPGDIPRPFNHLSEVDRNAIIKQRISMYSRKVYSKIHETKVMQREAIICQKENPFYVNTVRAFRDRRYEYKGLLKVWKKNVDKAASDGDMAKLEEAKNLTVLYDSLQLAHKCILNSFYGYVMRKGARWYSMEMAGVVCLTGSTIIQLARSRVEKLGKPLELDTDGIWCVLPKGFPEDFKFNLKNGKKVFISYPCVMLNHLVHAQFTNHQYQNLKDPSNVYDYETHSENSIFFEVDGPYRAMILPSSTEEGKLLKKRYAVFNDDGSLAELKGFEVKRRGELKLIKIFQSQIFKVFLEGNTLENCYKSVATVADQWLDLLYSKGALISDSELFDLISENRSMSKSLEEYGSQKSTSISTAKRLVEFLGDSMVKNRGLACKFIISSRPHGLPVSERAIPVAIFQAETSIKKYFLRKWLNDESLVDFNIRSVLDWQYYLERFGSVIQKLITIPAAMQGVKNPVPRIAHPDWLRKRISNMDHKHVQKKITDIFTLTASKPNDKDQIKEMDIEDTFGSSSKKNAHAFVNKKLRGAAERRKKAKLESLLKNDLEDQSLLPDEDKRINMPDISGDYSKFLNFQKRKWRRLHAKRMAQKALLNEGTSSVSHLTGSEYFRQAARTVLSQTWHVIQIAETDIPGELTIWALVGSQLISCNLRVPRIIYVNSYEKATPQIPQDSIIQIEHSSRQLPNSHLIHNLYRMEMPESYYKSHHPDFSAMSNHPDIEGVYESKMTLLFRSLLQVGCMATICPFRISKGQGLDAGLDLKDIQEKKTLKKGVNRFSNYLASPTIKYLYLYVASVRGRQLIALVCSTTQTIKLFVTDVGRNKGSIPKISALYQEAREEFYNSSSMVDQVESCDVIKYPTAMKSVESVFKTEKETLAAVDKALKQYQDARVGSTILAVQSVKSLRYLQTSGIHALKTFPKLSIAVHKKDLELPALGWQDNSARRMLSSYFELSACIKDRIELARYANVPLCCVEQDYTVFIADLKFARRLNKLQYILWASPTDVADLGHSEETSILSHLDEIQLLANPDINVPGTYDEATVEYRILDLALNALMQSNSIKDLDSAASTSNVNDKSEDDANLVTGPSFNLTSSVPQNVLGILRSMILNVADDVRNGNIFASQILEHIYRWISSSGSIMYHASLFTYVHGLMKRVFVELLSEFRRLGSSIIYADFNRVILNTKKCDINHALAYSKYLASSLSNKSIFSQIELKPTRWWTYLIWMDNYNYAGLKCTNYESIIERSSFFQSETKLSLLGIKSDNKIESDEVQNMEWNLSLYLPPVPRRIFNETIGGYLASVQRIKIMEKDFVEARDIDSTEDCDKSIIEQMKSVGNKAIYINQRVNTAIKKLVEIDLKRHLFQIVPDLQRHYEAINGDHSGYKFPNIPGGRHKANHYGLGFEDNGLYDRTPALEFVKSICAVLGLNKNLDREIRILKRDLLVQLNVKEFSPEAEFTNPCEPLTLRHVICPYCNHCQDLDLTRDGSIVEILEEGQSALLDEDHIEVESQENATTQITKPLSFGKVSDKKQSKWSWSCPMCNCNYGTDRIEQRLVCVVRDILAAWQLQDLRCSRCKLVKAEDLREGCAKCSGNVVTTMNRTAVLNKMKSIVSIADFYQMNMLLNITKWITSNI